MPYIVVIVLKVRICNKSIILIIGLVNSLFLRKLIPVCCQRYSSSGLGLALLPTGHNWTEHNISLTYWVYSWIEHKFTIPWAFFPTESLGNVRDFVKPERKHW